MVDSEVIHYSRGVLEDEDKEIAVLEARLEPEVHLETGYGTVLFVDNTPVVAQDKYDKLVTVLLKVFNTCGKVAQPDGLFMPLNPATGKTEGFAIVEYETASDAHTALAKLRGYQLDKRHKFSIMPYTEFSHLLEVPDVFEEKKYPTYEPKFNPVWWLTDSRAMDQYVVRYGDETEIFWNETLRKPDPVYSRTLWTDSIVSWSPRGTYLATYHPKGVILWAGENWVKVDQFSHPDVKLVEFSPCESYMVTDSSDANQSNAIVWDIRSIGSSNLDRQQPISQRPFTPGPGGIKWSFDGQYFAMNNQSSICVYEAATMSLLDKKRLKMTDCKDFSWSPSDHIIAIASIPESTELPSRVVLVHIPTRTELATKTLFNVNKCSMHWQEQGNFLCVQVNRSAKKKAVATTNLEVFRMREKNIPIESLSFKDEVVSFAWEPVGKRFAMIHTEGTSTKSNVSFYEVGVKMKEIKKLENRQANQLFWSPKGSAIVLANFRSFAGALEFFNADLMQTMGEGEHMMATKLAWDPAGRFVATHVRMPQLETGYALWSFQGQLINKVLKDRFTQFAWRPRPPTLLSAEKQKEIKKNLSKYAKEYKKDEDDVVNIHIREDREKKAQYSKEFAQRMAAWKRLYDEEKPKRQSLRGGEASDNEEDWLTAVEEVEEVIEEIEESI